MAELSAIKFTQRLYRDMASRRRLLRVVEIACFEPARIVNGGWGEYVFSVAHSGSVFDWRHQVVDMRCLEVGRGQVVWNSLLCIHCHRPSAQPQMSLHLAIWNMRCGKWTHQVWIRIIQMQKGSLYNIYIYKY